MEKKKFKFNFIDLIILLLIIAAIAALVYIFVFRNRTVEKHDKYNYVCQVEITRINEEAFRDEIKVGTAIYNPNPKTKGELKKIGEVTDVSVRQTHIAAFNEETEEEFYPAMENLIDIVVTFEGEVEKTKWGYQNDDLYLTVNDMIPLMIGEFRCTGTCTMLEIEKNDKG